MASRTGTCTVTFTDCSLDNTTIHSTWKSGSSGNTNSISTQTSKELCSYEESETQTGVDCVILQDQITDSTKGLTLLQYFIDTSSSKKQYKNVDKNTLSSVWRNNISQGHVTVDAEVCYDTDQKLDVDYFIEYACSKRHIETQTVSLSDSSSNSSSMSESKTDEYKHDENGNNSKLNRFLNTKLCMIEDALETNTNSRIYDCYIDSMSISSNSRDADEITHWKSLSVDLEKKKVVFPDWSQGRYYNGQVSRCIVTRNKERIYDIEYDDGIKLYGVREEYIRYLTNSNSNGKEKLHHSGRLQEGMRVHAKSKEKRGSTAHIPGRIVKCNKGTFDIECEGGRLLSNVTLDDMFIGLNEGDIVEAKRASIVQLQTTGISWTCTGSTVAVSYGRLDITGWCDYPGAVCLWSIFDKTFTPDNPTYTLDHTSCLMCVQCHPTSPSLIAAGSFNGELLVWDISVSEQVTISPVFEYSHKDAIMDIEWVWDSTSNDWLIVTSGLDGKLLIWTLSNMLLHPIRGSVSFTSNSSSRRQFPNAHSLTKFSFAKTSNSLNRPQWVILGQECGGIIRSQASRVISNGPLLTQESFRSLPTLNEVYTSLKKTDDSFVHSPHIGTVSSITCSPFNRNLFLTTGNDGSIKIFHILERLPLYQWNPSPPSTSKKGNDSAFSSLTCGCFSPIRPLVFAAVSSDGFMYLFDLLVSTSGPIAIIEIPSDNSNNSKGTSNADIGNNKSSISSSSDRKIGFTSVAFNTKQREFIAATDYAGSVHIWRLAWKLSNMQPKELQLLNIMGNSGNSEV